MAYTIITPERFKTLRQQFVDVEDIIVQHYIDLAQIWTDGFVLERTFEHAQVAVVCHLMTLDGLGTDPESVSHKDAVADMHIVKSGTVTLTRFRGAAQSAGKSTEDWFAQTSCGRFFLVLRRMNFTGPVVVGGGVGHAITGYAKDLYRDSWWP